MEFCGCGHELLTIIVRFTPIQASTLDPDALVRKLTSFTSSTEA
ncbi:MAG: hypothetical protein RL538_282 [Candidatus Parcubacteria bacterium]|jgi:hypothetical protein